MSTGRAHFTATLLNSGRVLVTGGRDSSYAPMSSSEYYNPDNNTWNSAGSITTTRVGHSAVKLSNGKVLISGGCSASAYFTSVTTSCKLYDPDLKPWTAASSLPVATTQHTTNLLSDEKRSLRGAMPNRIFV